MESNYYEVSVGKDILSISRNKKFPAFWDFCFNGISICSDYIDPNEAAFDASKADFAIEWLHTKLNKIYVPSNLAQWRKSKRTASQDTVSQNN
jgi:hypothetical protein